MANMIGTQDAALKWGMSARRVQKLCSEGRIFGATKVGNTWLVPESAARPSDARSTRYKEECVLPSKDYLTSIDLFSGPGGLATGFRWAGIKPLIAVEWSYWTAQTYAKSHDADIIDLQQYLNDPTMLEPFLTKTEKPVLILGDINLVEADLLLTLLGKRYGLNTVDVVTGGAPCESFSMAGDRKEKDDRNHLYQNVLRIARIVNARMFMFENVKGLFSKKMDGRPGAMYQAICDEFEGNGRKGDPSYRLASRDKSEVLLHAVDYGVPQARERLFLVGLNNNDPRLSFEYPRASYGEGLDYSIVTVDEALGDLPKVDPGQESTKYVFAANAGEGSASQKMFLRRMRGDLSMPPVHISFDHDSISSHKAPGHTARMLGRIKLIRQGESMKTASERLIADGQKKLVKEFFPKKIYGARNRRLKSKEPSFTVTSHCLDEMIHPTSDRGLTPREAARLQSFPDWYIFQGPYMKFHSDPEQDQYEQIGDAIPPLLAYALGKQIVKALSAQQQ